AGGLPDQTLLEQVEREIARARADLEGAEITTRLATERLADLGRHLLTAGDAEVDPPLGVVVPRGDVVVAGVGLADLIGAEGGRHDADHILARPARAPQHRRPPADREQHALRPARPARRRPPAGADRRAHAPRRARGELLVPPPPRRLRLDRAAR